MFKKVISLVVSLSCIWAAVSAAAITMPVFADEAGTPAAAALKNDHVVCLDPGHQSYEIDMSAQEPDGPGSSVMKAKATSGTQGTYTGIPEYALNLDVSLLLRDILEKRGYRVVMTRTDNETAISNSERAIMAGEEGAEIFVRIHANGENTHQQTGALALCPSGSNPYVASLSEKSERLSSCILDSYCKATGFMNLGVQYNDSMSGINWSTVPVTILEMGFMTNESDDTQMANVEFRQVMAAGIADGIDAYFGIDTSAIEKAAEEKEALEKEAQEKKALEKEAEEKKAKGKKTEEKETETESAAVTGKKKDTKAKTDADMEKLMAQLKSRLPKDNGKWSVYVCNLATGVSSSTGSKRMQAASLIKLYIMGAVYENYDKITKKNSKEQVDILLHDMIAASDNDAANTLTEYLGDGDPEAGMKAVTAYCEEHGYKDSHMGRLLLHSNEFDDNYTSVQDCGMFLTRVYNTSKRSLSGMPGAKEMYELLKGQTRKNKIPAKLPEGVHVANKTGELADVENDAGIIYDTEKNTDLVVCFMSEELKAAGNAQETIGELAQFIYSYYNG